MYCSGEKILTRNESKKGLRSKSEEGGDAKEEAGQGRQTAVLKRSPLLWVGVGGHTPFSGC